MKRRIVLAFLAVVGLATATLAADTDSGTVKGVIAEFIGKGKVKLLTVKVQEPGQKEKPGQDPVKPGKPDQTQDQKPGKPEKPTQTQDQKPGKPEKPTQDQKPTTKPEKPTKPDQVQGGEQKNVKSTGDGGGATSELAFIVDDSTEIVEKSAAGVATVGYDALQAGRQVIVEYGQATLLLDSGKPNTQDPNQNKPGQEKPNQEKPAQEKPAQDADEEDEEQEVKKEGEKGVVPPKKGKPGGKVTYRAQKITLVSTGKPGKPNQDQKPQDQKPGKPGQDQKPQDQKPNKPEKPTQDQKPGQDQKKPDQK